MMIRLSAAVMALSMLAAPHVSAATLSALPSTVLYEGSVDYTLDIDLGDAFALGFTSDGLFDLSVSGFFDPGTTLANLRGEDLTLVDIGSPMLDVMNARGIEEVELGDDFVWLLFGDLDGALAGPFTGGRLLAFFSDPEGDGVATFELRRVDNVEVIPLPATGLLLIGGMAVLGLVRQRSTGSRASAG
jgi:hypothetical protein